jgi:hypothetical protein
VGSTNRSQTAYVRESTPGVTPANPAFKQLRLTSSTLKFNPKTIVSNEIRSDRQTTDLILVDADSNGDIGNELSFAAYDDLIEAALQGTWANKPSIAVATTDIEISDISTTTATVASALGTPFKPGMMVLTGGFTTPANNGLLARVTSSTATSIVFPAATFATETIPVPVGAFLRVVGFQGASGDITATSNGLASTALDFTTLNLNVGEWHHIGGDSAASQFATAANNSWARLIGITAHALIYDNLPPGWSTDAGIGKTITVFAGDLIINGIVQRSFSLERQQQDLVSPVYEVFRGSQLDKMSLSFKAGAVINGTFSFVGTTATVSNTRTAGATDIAAPNFGVLNTSSNVGRLAEGGNIVTGPSFFEEIGFDLANNLQGQKAVGTLGSVGILNGSTGISGAVKAYFGDSNLLNKAINNTQTSLMTRVGRSDGNRESYVLDIPAAKITGSSDIPGKDQDRFFAGNYQGFRHPTLGYSVSIGRFWYLPVANS